MTIRALLEGLAFSSLWVEMAAALLCAAASRALEVPIRIDALLLAFGGTLAVYNVDRLRDITRDANTTPLRTEFVERHEVALAGLAAIGSALAGIASLHAGVRVMVLSLAVFGLGLLHRRLKHVAFGKAIYIAGAWTAIVVGVPVLLAPGATDVVRVVVILSLTLFANAVASSVRDAEAGPARIGLARGLRFAQLCAGGAVLLCLFGGPTSHLVLVAAATEAALLGFRPGERYGLLVLDGALVLGGLAVLLSTA